MVRKRPRRKRVRSHKRRKPGGKYRTVNMKSYLRKKRKNSR